MYIVDIKDLQRRVHGLASLTAAGRRRGACRTAQMSGNIFVENIFELLFHSVTQLIFPTLQKQGSFA